MLRGTAGRTEATQLDSSRQSGPLYAGSGGSIPSNQRPSSATSRSSWKSAGSEWRAARVAATVVASSSAERVMCSITPFSRSMSKLTVRGASAAHAPKRAVRAAGLRCCAFARRSGRPDCSCQAERSSVHTNNIVRGANSSCTSSARPPAARIGLPKYPHSLIPGISVAQPAVQDLATSKAWRHARAPQCTTMPSRPTPTTSRCTATRPVTSKRCTRGCAVAVDPPSSSRATPASTTSSGSTTKDLPSTGMRTS